MLKNTADILLKECTKIPLSPELEYIIKDELKLKNPDCKNYTGISNITQTIIKDVQEDRKIKAIIIGRRLLYCCPVLEQE